MLCRSIVSLLSNWIRAGCSDYYDLLQHYNIIKSKIEVHLIVHITAHLIDFLFITQCQSFEKTEIMNKQNENYKIILRIRNEHSVKIWKKTHYLSYKTKKKLCLWLCLGNPESGSTVEHCLLDTVPRGAIQHISR